MVSNMVATTCCEKAAMKTQIGLSVLYIWLYGFVEDAVFRWSVAFAK